MAVQDALDEIQWSAPDVAMWMGGIHENTVLHYFARSHFFNPTSNNASVATQATYNPSMAYLIQTREAFEGHLRTLQGLEYVVAMGPEDFGGPSPINEGTWVIRKQNRRKRPGAEDEITILATYFVVGQNIYMAPSIGNIIGSKLLATTSALSKLFNLASSLPSYTPAQGYRYLPASANKPNESANTASQSSRQSKEGTPAIDTPVPIDPTKPTTANILTGSTRAAESQAIYDAFSQFLRYGNEYMDDRSLVGEPGSFVFASNKPPPEPNVSKSNSRPDSTPPSMSSTLQAKDDSQTGSKAAKTHDSSAAARPKVKRRKSKAPTSPESPIEIKSPF